MKIINLPNWQSQRLAWIKQNIDAEIFALCRRNSIVIPNNRKTEKLQTNWSNWQWHYQNRLTSNDNELFLTLFPEFQKKKILLKEYLKSYNLSILPLNLLLKEGVKKFLPRIGFISAPDPYGVQRDYSVVLRNEKNKKYYLTTHKPKYASFLPILGSGAGRIYCPIGCAGCYRGNQTRFNQPLQLIYQNGTTEKLFIPHPVQQMEWLADKWNRCPEFKDVYDILILGGEPMMLSNEVWKKMLDKLSIAKYLKSFRICTGALFLGLPFRFDDEFVKLLADFRKETGVQIKIAAHVSHPEHITPEAIFYSKKLIRAGIEILPQCPLEPDVNFWINNLDKTATTLAELDRRLALVIGVRCFKWILDLQGGLSILPAIEIWRRLHDRHQCESDITRPTSFAIFLPYPEGNFNLSYHSLWAIQMRIDKTKKRVYYKLPHPACKWLNYDEPLLAGINDNISRLESLKNDGETVPQGKRICRNSPRILYPPRNKQSSQHKNSQK